MFILKQEISISSVKFGRGLTDVFSCSSKTRAFVKRYWQWVFVHSKKQRRLPKRNLVNCLCLQYKKSVELNIIADAGG